MKTGALTRLATWGVGVLLTLAVLTGCSGGPPDITGMWSPDDGSGLKTIDASGRCTGMYYSRGEPLDIGGGMSCSISSTESNGYYTLLVRQPPNEATYLISFDGNDRLTMHNSTGSAIVTLTRQ